jgi:hypothetical protein
LGRRVRRAPQVHKGLPGPHRQGPAGVPGSRGRLAPWALWLRPTHKALPGLKGGKVRKARLERKEKSVR